MTFDDDLRRTLRSEASRYDPADDGRAQIGARVRAGRARRRRLQGGVLGVAVVLLLVAGVGLSLDGGSTDVDAGPVASAPTTADTTPGTSTPTTTAPEEPSPFPGIWPFASQAAIDSYADGDARFEDPAQTADAFARDYLGMLDPVVGEPGGDQVGTVQVELRPRGEDGAALPDGGASTLVVLRAYETSYGAAIWTVTDARSPNIRVIEPSPGETIASPVAIRGEATGYEGTVVAQVRQDGMRAGDALGSVVGIAGSMGEMGPLELQVRFEAPTEPTGALVLTTDTGRDGVGVPEATVVRLAFGDLAERPGPDASGPCSPVGIEGEAGPEEMDVMFYLTCSSAFADDPAADAAFVPALRRVPSSPGVLRAALAQLVAGPTPEEEAAGLSSFFSSETADVLAGVTVADGTAVVDLAEPVPNASTSAGQVAFRGALNRTVLQFPTVERVEYRLDGSCDAFWRWQQVGDCRLVTRADL